MASEFNAANYYKRLREDGQLTGIRCNVCGYVSPEARADVSGLSAASICPGTLSAGRPLSAPSPAFRLCPITGGQKGYGRSNPYCTGIVTLEEGPRISARITGVDGSNPQSIRTGMDLAPGSRGPGPGTSLAGLSTSIDHIH